MSFADYVYEAKATKFKCITRRKTNLQRSFQIELGVKAGKKDRKVWSTDSQIFITGLSIKLFTNKKYKNLQRTERCGELSSLFSA